MVWLFLVTHPWSSPTTQMLNKCNPSCRFPPPILAFRSPDDEYIISPTHIIPTLGMSVCIFIEFYMIRHFLREKMIITRAVTICILRLYSWMATMEKNNHVVSTSNTSVNQPTSVPVRVAHELYQAGHRYLDVRLALLILSYCLL